MVIDFHTHYIGGKVFIPEPYDVNAVLAEMDANQIEKSLLLPLDGFVHDYENDNHQISELVSKYPERFIGMGTVNPRLVDKAIKDMQRCILEQQMIGIKFHPWLQAFSPLEDYFTALAEEANALKTMFFFHDGTPPYTEPFQIAEVARKFPDLTVVMGHSGLNDLWRESLQAAQKYENIWLCFCACPFWGMQEIATAMNGERIVWGSDYPLATMRDTRDRIRQVEHLSVSDEIKENILYRNAKELIRKFSRDSFNS